MIEPLTPAKNMNCADDCCAADKPLQLLYDEQEHEHQAAIWEVYIPVALSLTLLLSGIVLENYLMPYWFTGWLKLFWFIAAYLPVGLPVLWKGIQSAFKGDIFTEFLLMSIATIGAFFIGQYAEGVAVMLFYAVGELFQDAAVNRAKKNIRALLDVRPDFASVLRSGKFETVKPETVSVSETIQVKAGERVPLDGEMLSEKSSFNTAALTGESKPDTIFKGDKVLAGMINIDRVVEIKVTKPFANSAIARVLELVQNATTRKAKTELFIRKFARTYTPIVVMLAVLLTTLPYFFVTDYKFSEWLYRALIFLVISCPCALVISIPLGYFGGIGAASRNGILFKGSNYLDIIAKVNTVVMDKTGTLTKGVFKVQKISAVNTTEQELILLTAAIENKSTHPVATAIKLFAEQNKIDFNAAALTEVEEISGLGLKGKVNGKEVLAGNQKLLEKFNVAGHKEAQQEIYTIVQVAIDGVFAGYFTIADELKEDAALAIQQMHLNGVTHTLMLSGDKTSVVNKVAAELKIENAFGDLLPENKMQKVEELKRDTSRVIAFVGDGINDAPVLALSDVGIAMGGLGSDAAIEMADVIIQTDQPSKIVTAIKIGRATRTIVWQNIILAFAVKAVVLGLGAGGIATMWEAVFADVGVALLAIVNAIRIQRMKF